MHVEFKPNGHSIFSLAKFGSPLTKQILKGSHIQLEEGERENVTPETRTSHSVHLSCVGSERGIAGIYSLNIY